MKSFGDNRGFIKRFTTYYTDFWNYPDVIPPVLIIVIIIADTVVRDGKRPGMDNFRITL